MNDDSLAEVPVGVRAAMAMANGNRPTIQAEVVAAETAAEASSGTVVFVVKVSTAHDSYNSYTVRRRYRQFDALHTTLKQGFRNLPELPAKGSMSTKDQKFVEKRREGLSNYLRALMADPVLAGCDDVRGFLEFSSAEQLIGKLHEKDLMVNALVGEKDKALEGLRARLAEVAANESKQQSELAELRAQLQEAARAREQIRASSEAALATARQQAREAAAAAAAAAAEAQAYQQRVEEAEVQIGEAAAARAAAEATAEAARAQAGAHAEQLRDAWEAAEHAREGRAAAEEAAKREVAAAVGAAAARAAAAEEESEALREQLDEHARAAAEQHAAASQQYEAAAAAEEQVRQLQAQLEADGLAAAAAARTGLAAQASAEAAREAEAEAQRQLRELRAAVAVASAERDEAVARADAAERGAADGAAAGAEQLGSLEAHNASLQAQLGDMLDAKHEAVAAAQALQARLDELANLPAAPSEAAPAPPAELEALRQSARALEAQKNQWRARRHAQSAVLGGAALAKLAFSLGHLWPPPTPRPREEPRSHAACPGRLRCRRQAAPTSRSSLRLTTQEQHAAVLAEREALGRKLSAAEQQLAAAAAATQRAVGEAEASARAAAAASSAAAAGDADAAADALRLELATVETATLCGDATRHSQLARWQPFALGCCPHSGRPTESLDLLPAALVPPLKPGELADFAPLDTQELATAQRERDALRDALQHSSARHTTSLSEAGGANPFGTPAGRHTTSADGAAGAAATGAAATPLPTPSQTLGSLQATVPSCRPLRRPPSWWRSS